ncbi:MAG: GDSL-type esterase/lipase family protein [Myxococcota bacterium]
MRRPVRALVYVLWLLVVVPLGFEAGIRGLTAIRHSNPGFLTYPYGAALVGRTIGAPQANAPRKMTSADGRFFIDRDRDLAPVPLNASGFRGRDITTPRQSQQRWAVMGGSSTFCPELSDEQTWPARLERRVHDRDGAGHVEILNLATVGWSSAEVARDLQRVVLPAADPPELVILTSAYNNLSSIGRLDLRAGFAPWHRRLLYRRSLAYTSLLLHQKLREMGRNDPLRVAADRYAGDLEDMVTRGQARGVRFLFVLQPVLAPEAMDFAQTDGRVDRKTFRRIQRQNAQLLEQHGALLDRMVAVADDLGVPWVDPRPVMLDAPGAQDRFWAFLHVTAEGAQDLAAAIDAQVQEKYGSWAEIAGSP